MITSVDEYLNLVEQQGDLAQQELRYGEASDDVWFQIVDLGPDYARMVAQNKTLPVSVLRKLATHEMFTVRSSIARKRALPKDLFEVMSDDEEEAVRRAIAANAKTPIEILKKLEEDPEELVSNFAKSNMQQSKVAKQLIR